MHAPRLLCLPAFTACLLLGGPAGAQDKPDKKPPPPERKDVDRQLYKSLRDVTNHGADLYNGGDPAACYFLFHGALTAAGGVLEHRPELQKLIQEGLASAGRLPRFAQRAHALRNLLDRVRNVLNPERKAAVATLWDRLGGEANVRKVVDDFVAAAAADPKVDFTRGGKVKDLNVDRLKKTLVDQISAASGGPYEYKGRAMREVHRGMGITDAEFDALAAHLQKALEQNGARPEDVAAVMKVIAGTRPDIVDKKPDEKKPEPKKPADKDAPGKPPV